MKIFSIIKIRYNCKYIEFFFFRLLIRMKHLEERWEELPPYFITSAEKKLGRDEVLDYIEQINKSLKEES